jgi:hypothetical protein
MRVVVDDDVRLLLRIATFAGYVLKRDQPIEAFRDRDGPGVDGRVDCVEVFLADPRLRLHGDREVGVVPPVAGVVVGKDHQAIGIRLRQVAIGI